MFTIEDIVNTTLNETERKEVIQKKMPAALGLIDDKIKSLLKIKLYQWKNIARKVTCDQNATIIQRFLRKKLGNYFLKKRVNFFSNLSNKYLKKLLLNAAKVNALNKTLSTIIYRKLFYKLKTNRKHRLSVISLNDNILKANDNLNNKNKKIAIKKIIKLYSYIVLKNLFEHLHKTYKKNTKGLLKEFWDKMKTYLLKKAEFSYGNRLSNEKKSISKKLTFSSKKPATNVPKSSINESITYISLVPHLIKYLEEKIKERKNDYYQKLKTEYKNKKLCDTLVKYLNKKQEPDKKTFFNTFKKSSKSGEMQIKLYRLFRKKIIKKILTYIEEPSRLLKLMYLIKITIVNKEISEKRWIRVLIRKWRFKSFSKNISKKKMAFLYKHLHVNYLEMVNDVFGEEEQANPSVIKEFERFGSNVGMWENEHPGFIEESNFCKNVQKRFSFHAPSGLPKIGIQKVKEVKEEELVEKKEIKEIKKVDDKDKKEDEKEVEKEDQKEEEKKTSPKRRKYYRKSV